MSKGVRLKNINKCNFETQLFDHKKTPYTRYGGCVRMGLKKEGGLKHERGYELE